MAETKQTVLVVIPAFNEGKHIAGVVTSIPRTFKIGPQVFITDIVVVDDGSSDDTAAQARKAGAIVLKHVVNTGAGGATRTGLRYAEQLGGGVRYVVTIDGDGQHASDDINRLVEYAAGHDSQMIVGNRLHAANKASMPLIRRLANWFADQIGRVLFGIKATDTQSGLRLYRYDIIPTISHFTLDRYGFCTESLWHATRAGVRVDDIPIAVSYSKEGLAKGQSGWAALEIVRDLIRVRIAG